MTFWSQGPGPLADHTGWRPEQDFCGWGEKTPRAEHPAGFSPPPPTCVALHFLQRLSSVIWVLVVTLSVPQEGMQGGGMPTLTSHVRWQPIQTPPLPHLSGLNRRSPSCSRPNYRRQVPSGLERDAALHPRGHCHRDAQTPSQLLLSCSAPLFSEDRPEDLTPTGVVAHVPSSPSPAVLAGCHAQVATKTWAHGQLAG